jgi:glycolate oxidase iron-sulfur subunit
LQRIPGILFVRTTPATACCGGAGSFMVTQPELSDPLMARTWAALQGSNPEYVLISSPSCAMQLQRGAHAEGSEVQVLHVAEFLAMAYEAASAT